MKVRLVSLTEEETGALTAEQLIVHCARVSSSSNQSNLDTAPKLLKYLIDKKHWSPFEMVDMTMEIETSRAIAVQILRHRSFSFQEFSQRYSDVSELGFETNEARRQDKKNRQASHDDLPKHIKEWWERTEKHVQLICKEAYTEALESGIAKECARFVLPLSTTTRIYMKGSLRSWLHYLQIRCAEETQKEHRVIAEAVRNIFIEQFPVVSEALGWK